MGRLFWKFLLAIWGVLLTTGLGVGMAVVVLRPDHGRDSSLESGPRVVFVVNTAADVLRHSGISALRPLIEEWDRSNTVRVHMLVVDSNDSDLLGRAVPTPALERARALAREPEPRDEDIERMMHNPRHAVSEVRGIDGRAYLLFVPNDTEAGGVDARDAAGVRLRPPPLGERRHGEPPPHPRPGPNPWLLGTVGLLASLAFSALLAWYFAKPIRHLRWAFGAVAEGRLQTRVQPLMGRRRDEVADLGRDFDNMVAKLAQLVEAQQRLLHDVSHELRSPLARLQLAIDLARQDSTKIAAAMDRVELESGRLDQLVGELLTLSRLESGEGEERKNRVDVVELVAGVADDAQFEARANGRDVQFSGVSGVMVTVDVELMMRAVENVVRNAVKYTSAGSTVEINVKETDEFDAVLIQVADRGPGVPPDRLDTIFEPFFRCDNVSASTGFGLGLTIARRAIEANHGSISANNRDGGGLIIEIRLPLT